MARVWTGQLDDDGMPIYEDTPDPPSVEPVAPPSQQPSQPPFEWFDDGTGQGSGGGGSNVPVGTVSQGGFWENALKAAKAWAGWDDSKDVGTNVGNFLASNKGVSTLGGIAGLIMGLADKRPARGGGIGKAYAGPAQPLTRTIAQSKDGPIAKYAAEGGIMHAYASGGEVQPFRMEHGGFVMTKRAVDGAGGPEGIQQLIPGARMIGGPPDPTGRRDLTRAVIVGENGSSPAAVSRGEAYVPKQSVQQAGGSRRMYELMHKLQRRA